MACGVFGGVFGAVLVSLSVCSSSCTVYLVLILIPFISAGGLTRLFRPTCPETVQGALSIFTREVPKVVLKHDGLAVIPFPSTKPALAAAPVSPDLFAGMPGIRTTCEKVRKTSGYPGY